MRWLAAVLLGMAGPLACGADAITQVAYFSSNSPSLTADTYELLHAVAATLRADPALRLEIQGYADASGRAGPNLRLSQQRADAVRDFLVSLGVAPERLVARGYGTARPANDNGTLEQRASNRRVEFKVANG